MSKKQVFYFFCYIKNKRNDIKIHDVNPAYTSQYYSVCRTKTTRKGQHHEIMICSSCDSMDVNIAAAKNILARYYDKEISLYTPYKKVKEILDVRYKTDLEKTA